MTDNQRSTGHAAARDVIALLHAANQGDLHAQDLILDSSPSLRDLASVLTGALYAVVASYALKIGTPKEELDTFIDGHLGAALERAVLDEQLDEEFGG